MGVDELTVKFHHIIEEHRNQGLYSPIESVDGRVKSIVSILDKMQRKNVSMNDIEKKIEDLAGIRIICQFVEDIDRVVNLIKNRTDMKVKCEKDYVSHMKTRGYRSYHMIILYTVNTIHGPKELSDVRDEIMDAQNSHRKKETLVKDILNNIQNLYKVANQREVTKIQDEFYKVYVLDDMLQLKHFARQLDIISEGYRAQSL